MYWFVALIYRLPHICKFPVIATESVYLKFTLSIFQHRNMNPYQLKTGLSKGTHINHTAIPYDAHRWSIFYACVVPPDCPER